MQVVPTPASEVVHLVSVFTDTLDALPPTLTRSLSDLKELDAVLSGSLAGITTKLQLLLNMMHPSAPNSGESQPKYTPLDRLQLLREVTEEARVFRLGGEDKIRVATSTCEAIATHTSHLATLSTLLSSYLPPTLAPTLPPPSAPHGYPSSLTPASALARRQNFDYPTSNHPGAGSTVRMNSALGIVREQWDITRGRERERPSLAGGIGGGTLAGSKRKVTHQNYLGGAGVYADEMGYSSAAGGSVAGGSKLSQKEQKEKDPNHRHPNQYTKKRAVAAAAAAAAAASGGGHSSNLGGHSPVVQHAASLGMTAVESVREKRKPANDVALAGVGGGSGTGGTASRAGGGGQAPLYAGMATSDEYNLATGGAIKKRKQEIDAGGNGAANKSRKRKLPDASPDALSRVPTPQSGSLTATAASIKGPRRTNSAAKQDDLVLPANILPLDDEELAAADAEEDDPDGHTYCICDRVSFGEMIGCDGSDCEREWFHLSCVGLSAIPKGRWFCDECRQRKPAEKSTKKKR